MSQLVQSFTQQLKKQPDALALGNWHHLENKRSQMTYAQFGERVLRMASALSQQLQAGDRVLLLFEPGPDFAVAFWACLCAGMVAVPTYPPADPRTRNRFLEIAKDAEAAMTLTTEKILKQSRLVRWFVGSLRRMRWAAVEDLEQTEIQVLAEVPQERLALLQYTSGSTDKPRGVMLNHSNVFANVTALDMSRAQLPQGPERHESFVCWLPLYHDMGLISGVVMPLALGHRSTLLSPLHFLQKPIRWLQALSDVQGTISAGPNFAFELCLRKVKEDQLQGLDLSAWAVILNGAERILPETMERFYERFKACGVRYEALFPAYGLAESTVFVTGLPAGSRPLQADFDAEALREHRVSELPAISAIQSEALMGLGKCWNGGELAIVEPETRQRCTPNQVGEIWLRGPSIGQGYWRRPELTQEVFQAEINAESGHWLRSGDLGFIWQAQLFITGRMKELIILHGQNYHPQPLEHTVQASDKAFRPGNGAAFSVGNNPEKLVIMQEVRKGTLRPLEELKDLARKALSTDFGLPLHDLVLLKAGDLPKTSSGKIQRGRAREMYLKGKYKQWKP